MRKRAGATIIMATITPAGTTAIGITAIGMPGAGIPAIGPRTLPQSRLWLRRTNRFLSKLIITLKIGVHPRGPSLSCCPGPCSPRHFDDPVRAGDQGDGLARIRDVTKSQVSRNVARLLETTS